MAIGIGAALIGGAALGGASGLLGRDSSKNLTTTQNSAPWSAQVPYLKEIFSEAQNQYNTPREYYSGQTYAPFSDQMKQGLEMQYNRATQGSPIQQAGNAQNLKTINGDYLSPESNPYLQDTIDAANSGVVRSFNNSVVPQLQSQFSGSGRYGSGIQQIAQNEAGRTLQDGLSKNATNIAFQNYNNERNRQANAVANAPAYAMSDYNDIANVMDVGQMYQNMDQNRINEDMDRFYFAQEEPYERLNRYRGLISGNYGGTTTTTGRNPNYKSGASALLGGALGGAGAASSMMGSYARYKQGMQGAA